MEVKNFGQGRQVALDLNTSSTQNSGQNISVSNQVDKSISTDSNNITSFDKKSISEKDVEKAVDKFNKLLEDKSTHVEYEIYGRARNLSVRIVNNQTKEVIKEIPSKKLIDMIDKLCELAGVFLDEKA